MCVREVYEFTCVCLYTCVCVRVFVSYVWACVFECVYVSMCVFVFVYVWVCLQVYVFVHVPMSECVFVISDVCPLFICVCRQEFVFMFV